MTSNQQENTAQSTEKIDGVKMVCSEKSIGCKSTAFKPVALHLHLTPELNHIILASQRQLLAVTSSLQQWPFYLNVYLDPEMP